MDRRRFITVTGAVGIPVGIAGCLGPFGDDDDGANGDDDGVNGDDTDDDDDEANGDDNGNGDPDPEPPTAAFDWEPEEVEVEEEVTFNASDSTGDITEFRWEFTGDESVEATGENVTHTFTEPGEGTVRLTVYGEDGTTDETESNLVVNHKPLNAAFTWEPTNPDVGEEVTFDASDSVGDIQGYVWVFEKHDSTVEEITDTEPTLTHTFDEEGQWFSKVLIASPEREAGHVEEIFVGIDPADVLEPRFEWSPEEPSIGEEVTFDASDSVGDIVEYRWDFTGNGRINKTTDEPIATYVYEGTPVNPYVQLVVEGTNGQTVWSEEKRINISN